MKSWSRLCALSSRNRWVGAVAGMGNGEVLISAEEIKGIGVAADSAKKMIGAAAHGGRCGAALARGGGRCWCGATVGGR